MGDRSVDRKRQRRAKDRRDQLLMCARAVAKLAKHRKIEAMVAGLVEHDLEIRRVLETVVRRWTKPIEPRYISTGAANRPHGKLHREHLVPCRVLVDRMIMKPRECRALLDTAVIITSVTPKEHRQLGGIFLDHEELYGEMLKADISRLPMLGKERYADKKIKLQPLRRRRRAASRGRSRLAQVGTR